MAEIAPWLQQPDQSNIAPWLTEQPGYVEDMVKATPSAAAKGVISVLGTGGDLQEIAKVADEKGYNPIGWMADTIGKTKAGEWLKTKAGELKAETAKTLSDPFNKALAEHGSDMAAVNTKLPSSKDIQGAVESVTGPFYEAKTGPGKALQTGLEIAPALATGTGLKAAAVKAAGAGVASELAGEGADKLKGYLPKAAQPWAEPVARAVGAVGGTFTPAGFRRAVTPLPMSDEQLSIVNALNKTNPELVNAATAGQLTESPRLMNIEARLPKAKVGNAAQEAEFTKGAMKEAGINGNFTNIHEGDKVGQELGQIRSGHAIDSTNFADLRKDVAKERRDLQRVAGRGNTETVDRVNDAIKFGAMNNGTPVLSMPGNRYQYMRGELQAKIDAASSPNEKQTLSNIRNHLDQAFYKSVGTDTEDHLKELQRQYANYNVLRNVPSKIGRETVTPQEVLSAVGKSWSQAAANEHKGLAPYAQNSARVMTPHAEMPDKAKIPPSADLLLSALGGILGNAGTEGTVAGHLLAPSIYHGAADMGARLASSKPVQGYLANQRWRPGAASAAPSKEDLVRLLMTPQAGQIAGGQ